MIDFYFACTDAYAYDLAICLNAWCFETDGSYNITKASSMIAAYRAHRSLGAAEIAALPILARGAALRFALTRLVDWLNVPPGALVQPKDPAEYVQKLRFSPAGGQSQRTWRRGRRPVMSGDAEATSPEAARVAIWTDGACSGNPGPGGWGAILKFGDTIKDLNGGEAATTNNRMELTAAIQALSSLKTGLPRRRLHRLELRARRHHRLAERLEAQRLENRRQETG